MNLISGRGKTMTTADHSALFAEFENVSRDEWIAAIEKSLRGRSPDSLTKRSYEGIDLFPVATAEDLDGISACLGLPGQYPYLRGTRAAGYRGRPWLIAQELDFPDPGAFNQALHDALANGQTAIALGSSPRIETVADLQTALSGIDLGQAPLFLADGARALKTCQLLCAAVPEATLARLSGCIGYDPLSGLARTGSAPSDIFERMVQHATDVKQMSPQLGCFAVRSDVYHDAGASAVQELAIALGTAVAYLRETTARGLDVSQAAGKTHFFLNIGENFFMEIAKLRAIKAMWSQVARAFGADDEAQKIRLHARCGRRNKSRLDPHINILRATSEAMAAAIAGVDSITVPPFDAPRGDSDNFSRRIARNLQLILQEELHLTELIDPAGGSWHIEKLTDQLAHAAWKMFQDIEAAGGMLAALQDGTIQAGIEAIAKRRQSDLEAGAAVLVGVNAYLNPDEASPPPRDQPPPAAVRVDASAIAALPLRPLRLAEAFAARRQPAGAET
ncbi:MAG: methylmalonyl-CoA mutase subunit beta [Chloroflexi bacterium]|nr:methylmalonyl-CoA mutase subunit beta [Chloroflexota bacterium]